MSFIEAQRMGHIREYYFSSKLGEIEAMNKSGPQVLNLGIGNPDMMPPEEALSALQHSIYKENSHRYQSYRSSPDLRSAITGWYKNFYNVHLDPQTEVLPLLGSKEGIFYISMAFLDPGDRVLIPDPGYPAYTSAALLAGGKPVYYPLNEEHNWFPDISELEQQDLSHLKIMWVNYPHMPTGAKPSKAMFERLIQFGTRNGILICHDNPYSFILNDHPMSILGVEGAREVALELNSLSKSHNMPGWRLGMLMANASFVNSVLKVSSNLHSGMFLPLQEAAVEALKNPESWYNRQNEAYKKRRVIVWEILDLLQCRYSRNQAGLFVWARIPDSEIDSKACSEAVLKQFRLFITPGFIFGNQGNRYIRISLCSNQETLLEARGRIERSIR